MASFAKYGDCIYYIFIWEFLKFQDIDSRSILFHSYKHVEGYFIKSVKPLGFLEEELWVGPTSSFFYKNKVKLRREKEMHTFKYGRRNVKVVKVY